MSARRQLEQRDLSIVEPFLPAISWLVNHYFRTDVIGLERIPDGPVLFVGNHSGGAGSPDSAVFILAYLDHFGTQRPLYWLAHELLMSVPFVRDFLLRMGAVTASWSTARSALEHGACVIVYPGGELELHRPWTARNEIRFHGRRGFLRLARDSGVPLVPVVAAGGHNTFLPLTDGRRLARALRLDRVANLKTLPVSLVAPWGVDIGGIVPHLPLPAKIRVEVLDPINVRARFGDDLDEAYDHVTTVMQSTLTRLAR